MKYIGSKNRISKYLIPVIQKYIEDYNIDTYIEPFVGGANMIDKIKCKNKYGSDINENLIELLKYVQNNDLPEHIAEEEYYYVKNNKELFPKWYLGFIGFCGSFSAKEWGGYARAEGRDMPNEAIRNLMKQKPNLTDIHFATCDYLKYDPTKIKNTLFYCDIPYKDTVKYGNDFFDYELFYSWAKEMSKNNIVLISEYEMPKDFECILEIKHSVNLDSHRSNKKERIEKLFIVKDSIK